MFSVEIELKEVAQAPNFPEAYAIMHKKIQELLAKGTAWQILETTNFISWISPVTKGRKVLSFYEARDFAYDLGLIKDGKLQPVKVEVS